MADSNFSDRFTGSVFGRILILTLQTVLSSILLLLPFLFRKAVDIHLLKYSIIIAVGLLAGFSARRFLKGHTFALRLLVSFLAISLSLAVQYLLSTGFLGINLFFPSGVPDWASLFQLGLAAFGAILALVAFRTRPVSIDLTAPAPAPQISNPTPILVNNNHSPVLPLAAEKKANPKVSAKKPASAGQTAAIKVAPSNAIQKTPPETTAKKIAKTSAPKKAAPTPKKTRAGGVKKKVKKEIKFVGKIDHYCPYCLDPVEDHDPRGIKICPICKTRHHADCWGITGACQIPHSHES